MSCKGYKDISSGSEYNLAQATAEIGPIRYGVTVWFVLSYYTHYETTLDNIPTYIQTYTHTFANYTNALTHTEVQTDDKCS